MTNARGIDVSYWQTATPSLAGLSFAFVRASYGATGVDTRYGQHATAIRAAHLVLGAYHFGYNADGAAQATSFLAKAATVPPDLYVLDLEGSGDTAMTLAQASAFIAAVQMAGHRCGLYHSQSSFPRLGQDYDWVAAWSSTPPPKWDFWQYSDTYLGSGSNGDSDEFNGDAAALAAFVKGVTGGPVVIGGAAMAINIKYERWHVVQGVPVFDAPNGAQITTMSGALDVTTYGAPRNADGSSDFNWRAAHVTTGGVDIIAYYRRSDLTAPSTAPSSTWAAAELAADGDLGVGTKHQVTLAVDGSVKATVTV